MNKHLWLIRLFVGFVKLTGFLPAWLFFKPRIFLEPGADRALPKNCILVSNHQSLLDFVLYLLVFPFRTIRFLMAEVLFNKGKLFATFLGLLGGIRVDRDSRDFGFVADAVSVLDRGGTVGIFPQGRLPVDGKPFPFTVSTAFIATHSDAMIVPVYTDGNYGLTKRANVVIGKPFSLQEEAVAGDTEQEKLQALTDLLEQRVYGLQKRI